MLFSFFQKSAVKITTTKKGTHGKHWFGIVDQTGYASVMDHIKNALQIGTPKPIDKHTFFIESPFIRAMIRKDILFTGFPYWKGTRSLETKTGLITEWAHAHKLEAVIRVGLAGNNCRLDFFAIDYAFNKEMYKNEKIITPTIVGFIYRLENFDLSQANSKRTDIQFDEDFCGYVPNADEPDEIDFIGKIMAFDKHSVGTISGVMITIMLTPFLNIDTFIADSNLDIELAVGKQVVGLMWLIGTVEK